MSDPHKNKQNMFKCKKQKYRFMVVVVVVFNRKDGSLELKIKVSSYETRIWNVPFLLSCFFFFFFSQTTDIHYLPIMAHIQKYKIK